MTGRSNWREISAWAMRNHIPLSKASEAYRQENATVHGNPLPIYAARQEDRSRVGGLLSQGVPFHEAIRGENPGQAKRAHVKRVKRGLRGLFKRPFEPPDGGDMGIIDYRSPKGSRGYYKERHAYREAIKTAGARTVRTPYGYETKTRVRPHERDGVAVAGYDRDNPSPWDFPWQGKKLDEEWVIIAGIAALAALGWLLHSGRFGFNLGGLTFGTPSSVICNGEKWTRQADGSWQITPVCSANGVCPQYVRISTSPPPANCA